MDVKSKKKPHRSTCEHILTYHSYIYVTVITGRFYKVFHIVSNYSFQCIRKTRVNLHSGITKLGAKLDSEENLTLDLNDVVKNLPVGCPLNFNSDTIKIIEDSAVGLANYFDFFGEFPVCVHTNIYVKNVISFQDVG